MMTAAARLDAYARLMIDVGVNLQPDQILYVGALHEHAPVARALARAAYDAGARWVDVQYVDFHVRRALAERGPESSLDWTPPWLIARMDYLEQEQGAYIAVAGEADPDLLGDLDQKRVGKTQQVELFRTHLRLVTERKMSWSVIGGPNEGWSKTVFGEPDLDRLWDAVGSTVRLDEPDPPAAWRAHIARLKERAALLNERRFDAIRFRGPGTDLTVGLMPESRWISGGAETSWGQEFIANLPTEEVFTSPDHRRTEGTVRSTRPLVVLGTVVRDLEMRFDQGRAVEVRASAGREVIEGQMALDDGAKMLGEVALVDGASRVGQTGLVFFNTLFDENATSHIAYGQGLPEALNGGEALAADEQRARGLNQSAIHTDFMIGGPEIDVDGLTKDGQAVPLLRDDAWQLG